MEAYIKRLLCGMWKYGVNYGIVLWTREVYCGSLAWNVEVIVWHVEEKYGICKCSMECGCIVWNVEVQCGMWVYTV